MASLELDFLLTQTDEELDQLAKQYGDENNALFIIGVAYLHPDRFCFSPYLQSLSCAPISGGGKRGREGGQEAESGGGSPFLVQPPSFLDVALGRLSRIGPLALALAAAYCLPVASAAMPVLELLQLAGCGAREHIAELDALRTLVTGQFCFHIRNQLFFRQ